jgi:hypothetical protein
MENHAVRSHILQMFTQIKHNNPKYNIELTLSEETGEGEIKKDGNSYLKWNNFEDYEKRIIQLQTKLRSIKAAAQQQKQSQNHNQNN